MPAGVSWVQYMKFFSAAMLSMMAGSQLVHMYYKPLDDINVYIEREKSAASTTQNTVNTDKPPQTADEKLLSNKK
ncbi:uncharacterized protein LOC118733747 [Rhagoletis pomonella]|uniref:uncharacterized protein LOC118733747 n=1 Tax=Rhagoletis pomonella TaxID=28610 RepID=UPI00177E799A|nr:uncharacterized protein LOC118733747 [Rhagoletis pomonella]